MKEDNLLSFVVDQLDAMGDIASRQMFGGWHVSRRGVFFAIVFKERLYFKTSETSRRRYEAMGMKPFHPREKTTLKTLYEVPVDILDDGEALIVWADEAIACQEAAQLEKETRRAQRQEKNLTKKNN